MRWPHLDCGSVPGGPGGRAEQAVPRQEHPVLLPVGEPGPAQPRQLHQPEVAHLVLHQHAVEHAAQPVLVGLDTPHKVGSLCSQVICKSTNGYFELSSNCGRPSPNRSFRVSWNIFCSKVRYTKLISKYDLPSGKRILSSGWFAWNMTTERSFSNKSVFLEQKPLTEYVTDPA